MGMREERAGLSLRAGLTTCALGLLMSLFAGCASSGGSTAPACDSDTLDASCEPSDSAVATQIIGVSGGTVEGPGSSRLVVPAGALPGDVALGLETVSGGPVPPEGFLAVGSAIAITPLDTSFSKPVTLHVAAGTEAAWVGRRDGPRDGTWEVTSVVPDADGTVAHVTQSAGIYVVFAPDEKSFSCPCNSTDPADCPTCVVAGTCGTMPAPANPCASLAQLGLSTSTPGGSGVMEPGSVKPCSETATANDRFSGCWVGTVTTNQNSPELLASDCRGHTDDVGFFVTLIGCGPNTVGAALLGGSGLYQGGTSSAGTFGIQKGQTQCVQSGVPAPGRASWLTFTSDEGIFHETDWLQIVNQGDPNNPYADGYQLYYVAQCGCKYSGARPFNLSCDGVTGATTTGITAYKSVSEILVNIADEYPPASQAD